MRYTAKKQEQPCHCHGHSKIGNYLPVISIRIRYHPIQDTEYFPQRILFALKMREVTPTNDAHKVRYIYLSERKVR